MATNHITISDKEDNYFEFGVETQGIDTSEMRVLFSIHDDGVEFTFPAKKKSGDMWGVTVPKIPQLKRKKYPFVINVISEGFFFEPLKGDVTVVGERGVKVTFDKSKAASTTPSPTKKVVKKTVKKEGSPAQKKVAAAKKKAATVKEKIDTDKIVQQAIENIKKQKPATPPPPSPITEPESKKEAPKKESITPTPFTKGRIVSGSEVSDRDKKIAAILAEEVKPKAPPVEPARVVKETTPATSFRRVTEDEKAAREKQRKKEVDIDALLAEMDEKKSSANPNVKFRKVEKD